MIRDRVSIGILAAACACLIAGSFALRLSGPLFVSPDETAAHFFARTYAETGVLSAPAALPDIAGTAMHPRSAIIVASHLVPGGFFGLPLLVGTVAALMGSWFIPFFPILLSVLAVLAWAAIWRVRLGERAGNMAGALLAVLPAWWLYTARSLMPNVPFMAGLIFSLFFVLIRPFRQHTRFPAFDGLLAGICFGTALLIRPSEAVWAGLLLGAVIVWQRRSLGLRGMGAGALGLLLALAPLPFLQHALYGSYVATGYTAAGDAAAGIGAAISTAPAAWQAIEHALKPLFPFGMHPHMAWDEFVRYGLGMFWWIFACAAAGLPFFLRVQDVRERRVRIVYLVLTLVVSAWLVLMYGSWTFTDNPDPTQITIGNSHVRYWIPIFLLLTPIIAALCDPLWLQTPSGSRVSPLLCKGERRASPRVASALLVCAWLIFAGAGFHTAILAPQDGVRAAAQVLADSRIIHDRVIQLTEPNAVIVVDRGDKLFFPDRAVRYPLRDEKTYALLPVIAAAAPLYYYGITLPPQDLAYLKDEKLKADGLVFEPVEAFGKETLYRIRSL